MPVNVRTFEADADAALEAGIRRRMADKGSVWFDAPEAAKFAAADVAYAMYDHCDQEIAMKIVAEHPYILDGDIWYDGAYDVIYAIAYDAISSPWEPLDDIRTRLGEEAARIADLVRYRVKYGDRPGDEADMRTISDDDRHEHADYLARYESRELTGDQVISLDIVDEDSARMAVDWYLEARALDIAEDVRREAMTLEESR